jgi:hypothetical protein
MGAYLVSYQQQDWGHVHVLLLLGRVLAAHTAVGGLQEQARWGG